MMYRNTFKLIISNFNLVWKILLYLLFSSVCVLGLAYACSLPIINLLHEQGIVTMFVDLFKEFSHSFNVYELLSGFVTLIENFCTVIAVNINRLWLYIVLFLFIVIIVRAFLNGFYRFATTNALYNSMSSNIKIGFTTSLFSCFGLNIRYQLASLIVQLPLDILLFAILYYLVSWLITTEGLLLLAPIALIVGVMLLVGFKVTLFSGWIPAIITFDCGVWKGLKLGVKAVFRNFYRAYSTVILIMLSLFVVNVVCALCTFGVSTIITLPLSLFTILVFNMVMFYSSHGMRFYVDSDNVVSPKRMEETDTINSLKYII